RDVRGCPAALVHSRQLLLGVVRVFFFQAEDGIRDWSVTGVQTCALPISPADLPPAPIFLRSVARLAFASRSFGWIRSARSYATEIGRASCRERVEVSVGAGTLKKEWEREDGETERGERRARRRSTSAHAR